MISIGDIVTVFDRGPTFEVVHIERGVATLESLCGQYRGISEIRHCQPLPPKPAGYRQGCVWRGLRGLPGPEEW